jgi:hypothetical protein
MTWPGCVLVIALATALPRAAPARWQAAQPFIGVTYFDQTETSPRPLRMHVAQIDLRAPGIRLKVSPPGGDREMLRQSTLEFLRQERAQLAINVHFFLPFPSDDSTAFVIGLAASEGAVFSAFETPQQRYALVVDAPALNIDRENRATIVHREPASADGRRVREPVELWNTVAGSSQIVTAGAVSVPVYRDADHPDGLLEPGGPNDYSNAKAWGDVLTARTAIGLSRDATTLTLFTVDVRGGSEGMRLREVAETLIREFDVWNALNLDGGGSTTMAMENTDGSSAIVNASSDSPLGRKVATSLAVFARRR